MTWEEKQITLLYVEGKPGQNPLVQNYSSNILLPIVLLNIAYSFQRVGGTFNSSEKTPYM